MKTSRDLPTGTATAPGRLPADLLAGEFSPNPGYLNTAAHGLLPARAARTLRDAVDDLTVGRIDQVALIDEVETARARCARLVGVAPERVALGSTVAAQVAVVAAALPRGAEVLTVEKEFSSVPTPFLHADDLRLRVVPPERLADSVGPDTALVAVSAAQSADGRVVDLAAVREAARAHGARILVDMTQAAGWMEYDASGDDFVVCATYKWLLGPRGASFMVVPVDGGGLRPVQAGWFAGADRWESCYGPARELAPTAARFDLAPAYLPWLGTARALEVVEEAGIDAIRAHDLALAERFRAGLEHLGRPAAPESAGSPIVSVPGAGAAVGALARAGVSVSARDGGLRASFHLYTTEADVDLALNALEGVPSGAGS
ncbi:aminotransferase class V-fold PLP-dependent enzyme [Streptomyces alkaliphilus]|uniref:aminotransferase class V-fold PLP-dependent enzyme n=1 Tax=Streptomyces alkaliphilus TaxID=1472722 RepID=UPI00117DBA1F|nr:aminotransferase class V-fold PLP-dependent enzyme [Streptomyces alkaliphilus]MQS08534.1 aminotransferase class V-fold PLP-dependent enzyme [Streptomyces alkaliphilus]